jgi:hypothetical protein
LYAIRDQIFALAYSLPLPLLLSCPVPSDDLDRLAPHNFVIVFHCHEHRFERRFGPLRRPVS